MKFRIAIFNFFRDFVILTKMILQLLKQLLLYFVTKTKVNSLWNQLNLKRMMFQTHSHLTLNNTIDPTNSQQVIIKGTTIAFLSSGNIHNLNDPDLSNFLTNTKID